MSHLIYRLIIATTTPRPHVGLFIQSAADDRTGYLMHVLGDVQTGYALDIYGGETDAGVEAERVHGFAGKELIGYAPAGKLTEIMDVCEAVAPPGRQMDEFGVKIKQGEPFYRDGEWVEDVVRRLEEVGLLKRM